MLDTVYMIKTQFLWIYWLTDHNIFFISRLFPNFSCIFLLNEIMYYNYEIVEKTTQTSAPGMDDIHGKILKAVSDIIYFPVSFIIDRTFCDGRYPDSFC